MIGPIMKKFARFNPRLVSPPWVIDGLFFGFLFWGSPLFSQSDSVHSQLVLPETTISEQRFSSTGFDVWKADSLPIFSVMALSSRLFLENGLQVRQNAPGTLATISARGAGPNRTSVQWNGLNLQSPMNGVVDAALLPLWPGDVLSVQAGGNSAAQSSGAMGGIVCVESPDNQSKRRFSGNLGAEAGSFSAGAFQATAQVVTGHLSSRTRAHWQRAENNFPFQKQGINGQPYPTRQVNNSLKITNLQQFNQWTINPKNLLKTAAWYQKSHRQIPPTITASESNSWQRDQSIRAVATWEYSPHQRAKLRTRAAWQEEEIAFYYAGNTETSHAQTALMSVEWQRTLRKQMEWRVGTSAQYVRAKADGYQSGQQWFGQARLGGYALAAWRLKQGGKLSAQLRQEWAADQAAPLTGTLGWELPIRKTGVIQGHFSRNVNLPTFNDRYWKNLGNADLLPEKGYSTDLGWVFVQPAGRVSVTAFHLIIDDWILWQPGADGLFRPGNLRKVSSTGIESMGSLAYNRWGIHWTLKGRIQISETKNTAVYGGAQSVLGKQLPYTPQLSAASGITAKGARFSAAYLHQYSGSRFITTDNLTKMPDFQTGTLLLSGDISRWRPSNSLSLELVIDNIWDVSYRSIANRPMPGRNWRAGVLIRW
jgi:iron complex outermembrane receptor protein